MGVTLRKAVIAEPGDKCIIENCYEKGEEVVVLCEQYATSKEKICMNENKTIQIVHAWDMFTKEKIECDVDENGIVDYDLGADGFNLIVNHKGEVELNEVTS